MAFYRLVNERDLQNIVQDKKLSLHFGIWQGHLGVAAEFLETEPPFCPSELFPI
jgi:hypothetical protein